MANYFRSDGWVKSALGPAVPGSQIYVCLQPANIASLPPSPLANIFSDPRGLVPLTQPIISDGFGHYDFYAQAGVYTLIVGLGGIIQQVYPDQSVGGGSAGGTAIVISVNGTPTANQFAANFQGARSVAVSSDGSGDITITGAVFQTNGATNTLQTVLNLKAGANIALASDALGGVTVTGTGAGAPNVAFMTGAGMLTNLLPSPSGFFPSVDAALDVVVISFGFPATLTFNTVSFAWGNAQVTIQHVAFAVYSLAGALLWQSGSIALAAESSGQSEVTVPSYTLVPGSYYLGLTTDGSPGGVSMYGQSLLSSTTGSSNSFNLSKPIIGIAANAATSGPLTFPATLGTINGVSAHGNTWSFPYIGFYNLP